MGPRWEGRLNSYPVEVRKDWPGSGSVALGWVDRVVPCKKLFQIPFREWLNGERHNRAGFVVGFGELWLAEVCLGRCHGKENFVVVFLVCFESDMIGFGASVMMDGGPLPGKQSASPWVCYAPNYGHSASSNSVEGGGRDGKILSEWFLTWAFLVSYGKAAYGIH